MHRSLPFVLIAWLAAAAPPAARAEASPAPPPLFQLFLVDGTRVHCYGEWARVGEQVVFTVPLDLVLPGEAPQLQMVSLAASRVDWDRTERYAESVRAARYAATRGERDFTRVARMVADTLGRINDSISPAERVRIAERAREQLAAWPERHHGYRAADVRQFVAMFDETVAALRQAAGDSSFDLTFVADTVPSREPLRRAPTLQQLIEDTFDLASYVETPSERISLLEATHRIVTARARALPERWARDMTRRLDAALAEERAADRAYARLTRSSVARAERLAERADVAGFEQLRRDIARRDTALGRARPAEMITLDVAITDYLDSARRLRLRLDHWELREPLYRAYQRAVAPALEWFTRDRGTLDAIRTLAGPEASRLGPLERQLTEMFLRLGHITPTPDLEGPHALLTSALHMARAAVRGRAEAASSVNMQAAWDASAAASGAIMLAERARTDIARATKKPSVP